VRRLQRRQLRGLYHKMKKPDRPVSLRCPVCGKSFAWRGEIDRAFPFCSKRCKMADLQAWFNEEYCISMDMMGMDVDIRGPDRETQP